SFTSWSLVSGGGHCVPCKASSKALACSGFSFLVICAGERVWSGYSPLCAPILFRVRLFIDPPPPETQVVLNDTRQRGHRFFIQRRASVPRQSRDDLSRNRHIIGLHKEL